MRTPPKLKLIVSDFHMGKGKFLPNGSHNPLEDFFYDAQFIEFLNYYSSGDFEKGDVELVCNGDFFNHLQLDFSERNPDVLTEKVGLRRMNEIIKGHPETFDGMKKFNEAQNHRITFILGNHDAGLLFPAVQKRLKEVLGPQTLVLLQPYRFDGVHIEHGHQFFADNAFNLQKYFLEKNLTEPVINYPWGSLFVIHVLNKIRRERPYFSKIYPFKHYLRWALIHDTFFAIRCLVRIGFYFLTLRFRPDPHRRSSFWKTIKIIKEVGLSPNLNIEAKKILLTQKEIQVVVFAHTHHAVCRQIAPGKTYLNTGLWNEQLSLEISNMGRVVDLTYGYLEYDEANLPHPSLKKWVGTHHVYEEIVG